MATIRNLFGRDLKTSYQGSSLQLESRGSKKENREMQAAAEVRFGNAWVNTPYPGFSNTASPFAHFRPMGQRLPQDIYQSDLSTRLLALRQYQQGNTALHTDSPKGDRLPLPAMTSEEQKVFQSFLTMYRANHGEEFPLLFSPAGDKKVQKKGFSLFNKAGQTESKDDVEKSAQQAQTLYKKAGLAFLAAMGMSLVSHALTKNKGNLGKLGIALGFASTLTAGIFVNSYYTQAAEKNKTNRMVQFMRGFVIALLFTIPGFKASMKVALGRGSNAPLPIERFLSHIKELSLFTLSGIGWADMMSALNFTRER